jgi:hypothetical protein
VCGDNRYCTKLQNYESVIYYMWQAVAMYFMDDPESKGIMD